MFFFIYIIIKLLFEVNFVEMCVFCNIKINIFFVISKWCNLECELKLFI